MSSLYEAAILNAWRQNGDEISFAQAKQIYFEIYFEKQKNSYAKDFMTNILADLKKVMGNYNLYYDVRRRAERSYDEYIAFNDDNERLKSYLFDHFHKTSCGSVNKILRKYGRSKTFNKGVWIYDPEYSHAAQTKQAQDYLYYAKAYSMIITAFDEYVKKHQEYYMSVFKDFKDSIQIEWVLPNEQHYYRGSKIVLKLDIGPATFEFNFDVRRFSVGMANLWTRYTYTAFAAEENNPIYFVNDNKTVDFYSLFNEIDKNVFFILNFIKK